MDKKAAIVSYGIIPYTEPNEIGMWNDEATFAVSRQALDKVGLTRADIDMVVISTMDGFDGITISNGLLAPAAGAYKKESIRVQTSGLHCVMSGMASIMSGHADVVVVASSDTVELDFDLITNSNQAQFFRGVLGFNAAQSYGLISMDYLRRSQATEADFALAASKGYQCGAGNPYAHKRDTHSVEEILASTPVNWPLRSLEVGGLSNGAAAIILASEDKVRELDVTPIWLTGIGAATNSYLGSWPEISGMDALRKASNKAYRMAGINSPKEEIDFAEIFNPFSPFELIACEALGFCEAGAGPALLRDGVTSPGGDLPVNLSGGSLCTNGPNSSGIFRTIQAVRHISGETPGIGMENASRGLIHDGDLGIGAVGGDSHSVLIIEKEA